MLQLTTTSGRAIILQLATGQLEPVFAVVVVVAMAATHNYPENGPADYCDWKEL